MIQFFKPQSIREDMTEAEQLAARGNIGADKVSAQLAVVVEGAGTAAANGTYLRDGDSTSKPRYTLVGGVTDSDSLLVTGATDWLILSVGSTVYEYIGSDIATPDLVPSWPVVNGTAPAPTVRLATWDEYIAATTQPLLAEGAFVDGDKTKLDAALQPADIVGNATFTVAASDETTELTAGTGKLTFRMPYAMTLTGIRSSVVTAPTGSSLTVDVNEGGVSILSTKLTIDATEKTSTTAATAAVISDSALADDAEITIDLDGVGATTGGAGLKITFIGNRA